MSDIPLSSKKYLNYSHTHWIQRAAEILEEDAETLRQCHTFEGEWGADEPEVQEHYNEMREAARAVRAEHERAASAVETRAEPVNGPERSLTLTKLQALADAWLDTLDDDDQDEWYTTERKLSRGRLRHFFEWVRACRISTPAPETPAEPACKCGPTWMAADCPKHGDPAALTAAARPPLTFGKLILDTARGDVKQRTLSTDESRQLWETFADAVRRHEGLGRDTAARLWPIIMAVFGHASRVGYDCGQCGQQVVFGDSICPITNEMHAPPESAVKSTGEPT